MLLTGVLLWRVWVRTRGSFLKHSLGLFLPFLGGVTTVISVCFGAHSGLHSSPIKFCRFAPWKKSEGSCPTSFTR